MKANLMKLLIAVFAYGLTCLLLDLFVIACFLFGAIGIFRSICLIYLSNFIVIPALGAAYSIHKILGGRDYCVGFGVFAISVCFLLLFFYSTFIEPRALRIDVVAIPSTKVESELTIAHISDVQSASVGSYEEKVFERLVQLKPDIIFHTGDLVQPHNPENYERELVKLAQLFKKLNPEYGIYNVPGNVDRPRMLEVFDEASEVRTIAGRSVTIEGPGWVLDVLGLSFEQSLGGSRQKIAKWLKGDNNNFKIVLGHAPDYVLDIMDSDVDLCLAGHTHGGQVNLPFVGALLNASGTPKEWASGLRRINKMYLNVSSGIGTEHAEGMVPLRFNCRPSVTVIQVRKE
jgi:hypothetical protein